MKPPTIIIPAAGLGRRMKSYGSKSLISLGKETVIARQIRIIKSVFPQSQIIVVVGFDAEKVRKSLPAEVKTVKNFKYEDTNVVCSILHGLKAAKSGPVLIIYGDLVFNEATLSDIKLDKSSIILDYDTNRDEEVGVNHIDNNAICLDYGLRSKWSHILLMHTAERRLFEQHCVNNDKMFGFEIINKVIGDGGRFTVQSSPKMLIAEIDSSKDINFAKKIIK